MADENIPRIPDHIEDVEDPAEALEAYARLIEHQQGVIDEHQQSLAEREQNLRRMQAQIEALKDSLMQSIEEAIYFKSEIMMAQQREQELREQIEGLQSMLGMTDPEDDAEL